MHLALPRALAYALVLAPFASAAIFPSGSKVKLLEAKDFRKEVLKPNRTSVVAFVAPWCGHCQRLAPEYAKAAASLDPLVPLYAVDCDAEENKRLCSEQGVKGFPTVKLFPRGDKAPPIPYEREREAKALIDFTLQTVPHGVRKQDSVEKIKTWANKDTSKPRALLLSVPKSKDVTDMPLLWKVLGNQYKHAILFAAAPDAKGLKASALGYEPSSVAESRVLVYPAGSSQPVLYEGKMKYAHLSEYFSDILDGSLVLKTPAPPPPPVVEESVVPVLTEDDQVVLEVPVETTASGSAPAGSAAGIHESSPQGAVPTATPKVEVEVGAEAASIPEPAEAPAADAPPAVEEPITPVLGEEQPVVLEVPVVAPGSAYAPAGSAAAIHESSPQGAVPTSTAEAELDSGATSSIASGTAAQSDAPAPSATSESEPDAVSDAAVPEPPAEPSAESASSKDAQPVSPPEPAGKHDEL